MPKGPKVWLGYFPEPEKTWYICKGEDEAAAQATHAAFDLEINFARGRQYLGGFVGSAATKDEYVKAKVDIWKETVETLSKVVPKYPQSAYVGITCVLQNEWLFLSWVVQDIAHLFEPIEKVIWKKSSRHSMVLVKMT